MSARMNRVALRLGVLGVTVGLTCVAAGAASADTSGGTPSPSAASTAGPAGTVKTPKGETPAGTSVDNTATGRAAYPGDPQAEAGYVGSEDDRLMQVNTVASLAQLTHNPLKAPYRLPTGSAYTLVLTARKDAYTVKDLLTLAPQTFVRQPDGSYLLSEDLVVQSGATLDLSSSGGLKLLLASDNDGFVSIVNYGGELDVAGTKGHPVSITSYDRGTHRPDTKTADGRAYVRSIGGQVNMSYADLSDLGFWSGRTGGLSLTGTDRPNNGQLDALGKSLRVGKSAQRDGATPAITDKKQQSKLNVKASGGLGQVLPSGNLPVPTVDVDSPQYSFVSASISNTTETGNAYGIFVSGANGLEIKASTFAKNLVDGVVMHRYVVNAVIQSTTSKDNGGDGFLLARATTGIVLSQVSADGNVRNGLSMSGLPLADGPSATGTTVGSYGNNSVANSEMSHNGRYGVDVVGGVNIGVLSNNLNDNGVGVVVREGTTKVSVVGNRVSGSASQGIAVRDGVRRASVTGNTVSGGSTSVYLRDSVATVSRNTLTDADLHAVSLVGALGATSVTENTIAGHGPSAIDSKRAIDLDTKSWDNQLGSWQDTTPFLVNLRQFLQPLTLMWLLLAALLVFTAVRGARKRQRRSHPYGDKGPVSDGLVVAQPGVAR